MRLKLAQYGIAHAHASGKADAMARNPDVDFCGIFEPDEQVLMKQGKASAYKDVHWFKSKEEMLDDDSIVGIAIEGRVCDNLAFCGEVRISRKHTRFAVRDLRHLTSRAVGQLGDRFRKIDRRIEAYQGRSLNDPQAHDLVIRAVDCRAITPTQVPVVLKEWRKPTHEQFQPRNAWSLFNAVTEIHKNLNPHVALARSQALHGLFDGLVGLN